MWKYAEVQFNTRALHNTAVGWEQGEVMNAPDGASYREILSEIPGAHFGTVSRGSYGFGSLLVPVKVRGSTQQAFSDARARLARTCAGKGILRAKVAGGNWVTATAVARAPFGVGDPVDSGTQYLVEFVLTSFWTTESTVTQNWTISSTNQLLDLTNWAGASAPMTDWVIVIRGTMANPEVDPQPPVGAPAWVHTMKYLVSLTDLQTITIDTTNGGFTMTGGGGHTANYAKLQHPGSPYPLEILPGNGADPPQVRMRSTGSFSANSRLTLTGVIAYLGI
jgi:hypothetical protein